jgi:hypothetical protein
MCRLADTVTTPKGESYEEYVTDALIEELQMAGVYDPKADIKISGNIKDVYGSSMLGNAYWSIDATVSSSNGETITVNTKREYPSAYAGATACKNMASSFSPTVEEFINDIITHEKFDKLLVNK